MVFAMAMDGDSSDDGALARLPRTYANSLLRCADEGRDLACLL